MGKIEEVCSFLIPIDFLGLLGLLSQTMKYQFTQDLLKDQMVKNVDTKKPSTIGRTAICECYVVGLVVQHILITEKYTT